MMPPGSSKTAVASREQAASSAVRRHRSPRSAPSVGAQRPPPAAPFAGREPLAPQREPWKRPATDRLRAADPPRANQMPAGVGVQTTSPPTVPHVIMPCRSPPFVRPPRPAPGGVKSESARRRSISGPDPIHTRPSAKPGSQRSRVAARLGSLTRPRRLCQGSGWSQVPSMSVGAVPRPRASPRIIRPIRFPALRCVPAPAGAQPRICPTQR